MTYTRFPLFQSHLDLAQSYWERLVQKGDHVIDATCGNGHDSLKLALLALTKSEGRLWCLDIQNQALDNTRALLQRNMPEEMLARAVLLEQSHAAFPADIPASSLKLIVYNLGYLPGGDKAVTTNVESTLTSLKKAQNLILPGGAISITCYPGHPEGAREQQELLDFISTWPPQLWNCTFHQWPNRRLAPSLLFIQSTGNLHQNP